MKLHQDDPRLTAYVLGELSPEQAVAVRKAADADDEIKNAIEEIEQMTDLLGVSFGSAEEKLSVRNRQNISRAAKEAARGGRIEVLKSHRQTKKTWFAPLAAAAVIAGGLFLLTIVNTPKQKKGGTAANLTEATSPESLEGVKISRENDISKLPLEAGKRSLAQITTAIRIDGRMPTHDEVRIEELLNAFPLNAKGTVALWKGCSLGAEIIPCPWKPSGNLVIISVHGARKLEKEISVEFRAAESGLLSHRLFGYSNGEPTAESASSKSFDAGENILLVIETVGNGLDIGNLVWSVDGAEAPVLHLSRDPEREPSEDAGFAALVSAFGLWLRDEEKPAIDETVVLGLAREVAAGSLVADRYDFLYLVDQAVKMAGSGETE